jgi:hypothetical protein
MPAADHGIDQAERLLLVRILEELVRAVDDREGILPEHVGTDAEPVVPAARQVGMADEDTLSTPAQSARRRIRPGLRLSDWLGPST